MSKNVVLYARISVSIDESVSISRQLDAGRRYSEARGWNVMAEYIDDGVSASANGPGSRAGWKAVINHPGQLDAVVIWKVDRLARRVIDFLQANEALKERGAGIVAVEDPIDMTTPQGRAFATVLAVFGELEAASISARVAAARTHLLHSGRVAGGSVPYGWMSIPNPDGAGFVLAKDPERIEYVRGMAERILSGSTVYAVTQWLDAESAPLPGASQSSRRKGTWAYSTVERLLRNPILAGQIAHNPGNKTKARGFDVLRDEHGMPIIDESLAVLTPNERRKLLALLDDRDSAQARPRASKGTTSPFLSRVVKCAHCHVLMQRGTNQGRAVLSCPECHQSIGRNQLDPHIIERLLDERGPIDIIDSVEITEDNAAELSDIADAIRRVTDQLAQDGSNEPALLGQLNALKELRSKARVAPPARRRWKITGEPVSARWERCQSEEERREVLLGQLGEILVRRGKTGRRLDTTRVQITWRLDPYDADADLAYKEEHWEPA